MGSISHLERIVGSGLEGSGLGTVVHNGVGHRGIADWADMEFNLRFMEGDLLVSCMCKTAC